MVARAHRSGSPLSIISVDLDWFKHVNDRHGHHVGDELLAAVGRTLKSSLRGGDVAARIGGEEFLLLLPDTSTDGALVTARRAHNLLAEIRVAGLELPVTASLGVATLTADIDCAQLLLRADIALYQAKSNGRNRTVLHGGPTFREPARTTSSSHAGD
jgi:two-component system cell cycle response regulator